jgi:hypothetical protein
MDEIKKVEVIVNSMNKQIPWVHNINNSIECFRYDLLTANNNVQKHREYIAIVNKKIIDIKMQLKETYLRREKLITNIVSDKQIDNNTLIQLAEKKIKSLNQELDDEFKREENIRIQLLNKFRKRQDIETLVHKYKANLKGFYDSVIKVGCKIENIIQNHLSNQCIYNKELEIVVHQLKNNIKSFYDTIINATIAMLSLNVQKQSLKSIEECLKINTEIIQKQKQEKPELLSSILLQV